MKFLARLVLALFLLFVPVALLHPGAPDATVLADGGTPVPPRKHTVVATFTWYDWWLVRWENNEAVCRILVEHTGLPTSGEILNACGSTWTAVWKATKSCDLNNLPACKGMYLHSLGSFPGQRSVDVTLPSPKVWLSLVDCNPGPSANRCTSMPTLLLTGEEPLPSEMIIRIQGTLDGQPFSCPGNICTLPLHPTGSQGVLLTFWGDSSRGDSTEQYKALLRVVNQGDAPNPEAINALAGSVQSLWMVDVLSSQFTDGPIASCSDTWQVFPDSSGPPNWLNTPLQAQDMLTTHSYYYLAGVLISNGMVDASACPNNGLAGDMVASECGLEAARPAVNDWQNKFDEEILRVAKDTGVPAQLMKNVFGRESQFWPGLYSSIDEAGLGQMTDKGADMLLMWNPDFFSTYCTGILSSASCAKGFVFLKPAEQDMLRGALVSQLNATCPDCPQKIDLAQAEFSVRVFAQSMQASCSQTARIVYNITNRAAGKVSSYVDLWKFTLANYNGGAACLYDAAKRAWKGTRLTWNDVSANLDPACEPAAAYVNSISGGNVLTPTPTPWVFGGTPLPAPLYPTAGATRTPTRAVPVTSTPQPSATPTPSQTPTLQATTPGPTSTSTPTTAGYPAPTQGPTPTIGNYP